MKILHAFADEGVESECLQAYGEVYRVGLDPSDTNRSRPIQADVRTLPVKNGVTFDLGLFHPPCQRWAVGSHINGDPKEKHGNLIPTARRVAKAHCDEWIIENVPQAPLKNATHLNGRMFGSPLKYERAFETSYHVKQPPREKTFADFSDNMSEHHKDGSWKGTINEWKSVKGYSGDYNAKSLKREAIPRAYIDYLMREYLNNAE